jgi:hypothetical protein
MSCAIHPQNVANAYCRTCGKALCPQCQHNVRGAIYCEDCLASRLGDAAPPPGAAVPSPGMAAPLPRIPDAPSPGLAAFLGFIPGVGAMYNGQFGKAIAHLFVFIGLWWASRSAPHLGWVFGLMIPFWIFYMVFDAYRTAHARELGLPAPPDPFGFENWWMSDSTRAAQQAVAGVTAAGGTGIAPVVSRQPASTSAPIGPLILIVIGAIALLGNVGVFSWERVREFFWPVAVIVLGVWIFTRRGEYCKCDCQRCQARGFFWPAILITLGTLLLLDALQVWRFWPASPVLLIVGGALLIMRRSASNEGHRQDVVLPQATPPSSSQPVPPPPNAGREVRNG